MTEKQVEFNIFESEFSFRKLPGLSEIEGGGTPDTGTDEYWGGSIPWITPTDLSSNRGPEVYEGEEDLTEKGLEEGSARLLPKHSVILTARGTVGESAVMGQEASTNQSCYSLTKNEENPYYLYYGLQYMRPHLEALGVGGTFDAVTRSTLHHFEIPVPPVGEQERIASVLYTVDQHVNALSQRHDYLTDLKHALMQDLLLGRRRLVEGEEAEPSGSVSGNGSGLTSDDIPSDWGLERVGNVCDVNASISENSSEVDYLPMDALSEELPWPDYTKKRNPNENSGTLFKEEDTLVAKITPCTENGKSAFIDELDSDFGIATTEVITLTPTDINSKYLYYCTTSHPAKNYAVSRMRGTSGRQRVPKSVFERELKIPVPSTDEQERIASVLYTVDEMIARTGELRDEYDQLKRGLMQDLLSGDVRTPETLEVLSEVVQSADG